MKGYIYLIRNKNLYKIGITKNIAMRMRILKPDKIIKVFQTSNYKELERKLHSKYRKVRIPRAQRARFKTRNNRKITEYAHAGC